MSPVGDWDTAAPIHGTKRSCPDYSPSVSFPGSPAHSYVARRVPLNQVFVQLILPSGAKKSFGLLVSYARAPRKTTNDDLLPENVDTKRLLEDFQKHFEAALPASSGAGDPFNPQDWLLEVDICNEDSHEWRSVEDHAILSRWLNSLSCANSLGLAKDPATCDWVLPCRYVHATVRGAVSGAETGLDTWPTSADGPSHDSLQSADEETGSQPAPPTPPPFPGTAHADALVTIGGSESDQEHRPEPKTMVGSQDSQPSAQDTQHHEVICISDSGSDLEDLAQGLTGSSGEPAIEDDGHDAAQHASGPPGSDDAAVDPSLNAMKLGGSEEDWAQTCNFFRHKGDLKREYQGKQLFGTTAKLRPGQMHVVWHFLHAVFVEQWDGHITALDRGLGKTRASLAIIALMRTVELMGKLCLGVPGVCRLAEYFDYQDCVCVPGSLMSKIHRGLALGITTFFAPGGTLDGAEKEAKAYLCEEVQLPDGNKKGFVKVVNSTSTSMAHFFAEPADRMVKQLDLRKSNGAKHAPKANKHDFACLNCDWNRGKGYMMANGGDMHEMAVTYTQEKENALFQDQHYLVLVPSDASSLRTDQAVGGKATGSFDFQVNKRRTATRLKVPWPIWSRFLVMDEFHKNKNKHTILYQTVQALRCRYPKEMKEMGRRMVSLFLSGTPFTRDLNSSLDAPLRCIIPESWEAPSHEYHATRSRKQFNNLAMAYRDARKSFAADGDDGAEPEGLEKALDDLRKFLAQFVVRRTVSSRFFGELELKLPPVEERTIDCSWEPVDEAELQGLANVFGHAQPDTRDGKLNMNKVLNKLRMSGGFLSHLYGATFVHPSRLQEDETNREALALINGPDGWITWIKAEHANKEAYLQPEGRVQHPAMQHGAIDLLCEKSPKIGEIKKILARARADDSMPADGFSRGDIEAGPVKKSVVVFCSRAGVAVLLAAYAQKHWSGEWNIHLVTAACKNRQEAIETALKPVRFDDRETKPAILIAVMSICGEGLNGMQKASYSVSVDLPFSEALLQQVAGRVYRSGQVHHTRICKLVSKHPAEALIRARHEKRHNEFREILEAQGTKGASGGASEDGQGGPGTQTIV